MGAGSLKWVWLGGEGGLPRVSLYRVDFCSNPKHVIMLTPLLAERLVPMNLPERAREFWSRLAPRGERERAILCRIVTLWGSGRRTVDVCLVCFLILTHTGRMCVVVGLLGVWEFRYFFFSCLLLLCHRWWKSFPDFPISFKGAGREKEKRLRLGIFPQTSQG